MCLMSLLDFAQYVVGDSLDTDKQVLLDLRPFPEDENHVNRGTYTQWNPLDSSPCSWSGIVCNSSRVTGINLSNNNVGGNLFGNFSALSQLTTLDLSGNTIGGSIPPDLGQCQNLKFLNLSHNLIEGELNPSGLDDSEILDLSVNRISGDFRLTFPSICKSLVVANISLNNLTGEIGNSFDKCWKLEYVDLSSNFLSGNINLEFQRLKELDVSNNSINGTIQPWVFSEICSLEAPDLSENLLIGESSFLGDPLLSLPPFIGNNTKHSPDISAQPRKNMKFALVVLLALTLAFFICGIMSLLACIVGKVSEDSPSYLLEDMKERHDTASVSGGSLPWFSDKVKVIRLDKTEFTHKDIFVATGYFSNNRIIGRGGFGTVYKGVLPDGREVAVKKQQREGPEGEREFRAEMEVLTGNGFGWPHPNLVTLYGWCLDGSEKLLVYEYMEGGSLEELILDRTRLTWRRRIDVALDVARALVFLHHECFPLIVHREVKASNVLLDKDGKARVTDFGLARVVDAGGSHVSTMVAGTVGYVAPEYGQTWQATTKGDVYSYGVLVMELATGRRAVDGGEECLVEWVRVMRNGQGRTLIPVGLLVSSRRGEGAEELCELLRIGIRCAEETPQARPNMKEVLAMLIKISSPAKGI